MLIGCYGGLGSKLAAFGGSGPFNCRFPHLARRDASRRFYERMSARYSPGDWVIYRKSKRSASPGPRAQAVKASEKGEKYSYIVNKFWVVEAVLPGDQLRLRTRRGKLHELSAADLNLRHANWFERLLYGSRFREIPAAVESPAGSAAASGTSAPPSPAPASSGSAVNPHETGEGR